MVPLMNMMMIKVMMNDTPQPIQIHSSSSILHQRFIFRFQQIFRQHVFQKTSNEEIS